MESSTTVAPPISPNAPEVGSGAVQQQQQEVMLSGNRGYPGNAMPMNPLLLASACLGSSAALKFLFDREDKQEPPIKMPTQVFLDKLEGSSTRRTLTVPQGSGDIENGVCLHPLPAAAPHDAEYGVHQQPALPAIARLLDGVTAEGASALHVVATHGESAQFLECASIINTRDKDLLFMVNRKGDTPLHSAARAGKSPMLSLLIELAGIGDRMHELLRIENGLKETALHDAVRIGNADIVERLLKADAELALYPVEGTSPLYLAILEGRYKIAEMLYIMSNGNLSYDGPHGRNALHAATCRGIPKLILTWNSSLTTHGDKDGSTPLHLTSAFKYSVAFKILFKANPAAVYQADNKGLFPIHVAASQGVKDTICIILDKYPSSAGLCTAQGRTFLHVAVVNRRLNIVSFVCRTTSLSWILNIRDNDGNTALHLAVKSRMLRIFCSLYGNKEVHLSFANNSEESPADLSRNLLPLGFSFSSNNENRIYGALAIFGINHAGLRWDQYHEKYNRDLEQKDKVKEAEKVKDSSQILGIGSVLIATMAFGATFAIPGGFIADDHANRGTPTLARRFTFDAFMMANTLAFVCSLIATIGLTYSGSPMVNLRSRQINLRTSVLFMAGSATCLSTAFALGVYMVLAPVALATCIAISVFSPLIVLYRSLEYIIKLCILARPLYLRLGPIRALKWLAGKIIVRMSIELGPFIIIFGWAAIAQKIRNH